ncbi:MAG TPA: exodeoxyribonuclease VII small subunit [Dehalococcoidia bacterium]
MASKKTQKHGFEAQYRQLEEAVAKLEEGNLTLEESLALYEDGMKLAKQCQKLLKDAELRVTKLQEQFADGLGAVREDAEEYETEPEDGPDSD